MRIVGGRLKGRTLAVPTGLDVRPTADRVRESVFNILAHGIGDFYIDGATVIDVFAGTGALGLEAMSRGCGHGVFIDNDPGALTCVRKNTGPLGLGRDVTSGLPERAKRRGHAQLLGLLRILAAGKRGYDAVLHLRIHPPSAGSHGQPGIPS